MVDLSNRRYFLCTIFLGVSRGHDSLTFFLLSDDPCIRLHGCNNNEDCAHAMVVCFIVGFVLLLRQDCNESLVLVDSVRFLSVSSVRTRTRQNDVDVILESLSCVLLQAPIS